MPDIVQNVIVDFQVDYSQLTTAQEQLAKGGKIDASQFSAINKAISSTATDTKGLIKDFKDVATTATRMGKSVEAAFGAGIQDALDEAGVSVEEFSNALKKANAPAKTLKAELRELKEALAQAKANGKDTGAEFEALRKRAGQLSDAMADANAEIKNAGSDTRNIDNVVGSISALAGGFAAAQGAAALFGDENEDVQKALLKVNGAMALASGIQQFYNATLKEGALTKLADSVATGAQSAATSLYTFVTGGATVATKLFRAALLATGIGAIVVLVVALVQALDDTTESLEDVNRTIEIQNNLLESSNTLISKQADLQLARAKAAGAAESELLRIQAQAAVNQFENISKVNEQLAKQRDGLSSTSLQYGALNSQIEENNDKLAELNQTVRILNIQGTAQIKAEIKERSKASEDAAKKAKELAEKQAAEARAIRLRELNDNLALQELNLLAAEKGGAVELDIQKKIIRIKRNIELEGEKVTAQQALLIRAQALAEQAALTKEFNSKATADQLQAQININAAALEGIRLGNDERLRLQTENIEAQAQLEINAAEGNAAKILLIEAKKLGDLRALRLASIDAERKAQIEGSSKNNEVVKNALQQIADDSKKRIEIRVAAINAIRDQELLANQRMIDDNQRKYDEGLISQKEYNSQYENLVSERAEIEENANKKSIKAAKEDAQSRIELLKAISTEVLNVAQQISDFFGQLASIEAEKDRERIQQEKERLQTLVDANAISETQRKIRANEIEIAERKLKQRQAVREKQQALFKAVLAIPQAFLTGLSQGGIVLAALYGALAAAQAVIIASKPVPKFFRGKKDNYAGPGVVADMGSELVERGGRMFLYTKPTQTYLGATDKVYNAAETKMIMHNSNAPTTIRTQAPQHIMDYERLAKAIPANSVNINFSSDFVEESVGRALTKNRYFNRTYQFKK